MPARPNTITIQQAVQELDDKRVKTVRPLIPPQILAEELPLDLRGAQTVLVSVLVLFEVFVQSPQEIGIEGSELRLIMSRRIGALFLALFSLLPCLD